MLVLCAGWDINDDVPKAAAAIAVRVKGRAMLFHWFGNILKKPSWDVQVVEELKSLNPDIELVDTPTFLSYTEFI